MLGRVVRIVFAITAMAPISISLAYVYATRVENLWLAAAAVVVCLFLGFVAHWIIAAAGTRLERLPITLKKAKSADKEVIGFVIAYALPLLFRGDGALDLGAWLIAALMMLFVLLSTHTLQVNPVLGLFGFHFYDVETDDGVTYLLITKRQINNILSVTTVVQLSEYGILESP
jgi:hypothetical protein